MDSIFQNTFLMAQIFGLCAMTCSIIAWQLKNPRHILRAYVPSSLLWSIQYYLLDAHSAAVTCVIVACKDLVMSYIPRQYARYFIPLFLVVVWGLGLPLVETPVHVIPLIVITAFNFTLLQPDNRGLMSRVNLLCQMGWLVFNLSVGAWLGVACAIFVMSSAFTGMVRIEQWQIGRCYRTFFPSIQRALFDFTPRTYP